MAHSASTTEDADTLAAVARADTRAFERLSQRFRSRILRFAHRIVERHDLADEVANDTLMVVWRRAADFQGRSSVATWVLGIARHIALKARGRQARRGPTEPMDAVTMADDGGDGVETALRLRCITVALSSLPTGQRALIELAYRYGYRVDEIAALSGCPAGTVKSRLFAARARLRLQLGDAGGERPAAPLWERDRLADCAAAAA